MNLSRLFGTSVSILLLGTTALSLAQRPQGRRGRQRPTEARPAAAKRQAAKKEAEAKKPDPIAYSNATIHVGRDGIVLRNATVLIQGRKILEVGSKLELPKKTKVVDCKGKHIAPGFIIPEANGMGAPSSVRSGEHWADSLDPFNRDIKRGLAVGITSFLTTSGGRSPFGFSRSSSSSGLPSGNSAIIKLIPDELDDAVLVENPVYSMTVPLAASAWKKLNEAIEKAKKYAKDQAEYEKKKAAGDNSAKPPKSDRSLESLLKLLKGEATLKVSSGGGGGGRGRGRRMFGGGGGGMDVKQIREALRLAKAIGHGVWLMNPYEGWIIPDEIAATDSSVLLYPRSRTDADPEREEANGSNFASCKILDDAGIPVMVMPPPGGFGGGGLGTSGLLGRDLNTPFMDACYAIRGGMDPNRALSTLTYNVAKALGVEDRIGSIEAGKDADLLILDGPPLHYKSFVQTAIVNGKVRYEKDKEPFYGHIRRSGAK